MTRKEIVDALGQFPESGRVIVRVGSTDMEIDVVCAEDIVPPDIEANPQGRVINGLITILLKETP